MVRCVRATSPIAGSSTRCWRCRASIRPRKQAGAGLSGSRSRRQRGRLGQALPDQASGDWRRCCRPPKSRRPTSVLVVGCATGYTAALVGQFAGQVTATESDPALAAKAKDALRQLGCGNVSGPDRRGGGRRRRRMRRLTSSSSTAPPKSMPERFTGSSGRAAGWSGCFATSHRRGRRS